MTTTSSSRAGMVRSRRDQIGVAFHIDDHEPRSLAGHAAESAEHERSEGSRGSAGLRLYTDRPRHPEHNSAIPASTTIDRQPL